MSFKLRDIMLEGVSTKIVNLTSAKTKLVGIMKGNSAVKEFNLIIYLIANKLKKMSHQIKKRHQRKYQRDHIRSLESKCKGRRFRKSRRKQHDRERNNDWLERTRATISVVH